MNNVIITGIGLISSLTRDPAQYCELVKSGALFYKPTILRKDKQQKTYPAAVIDLDQQNLPPDNNLRKMGRATKFALVAVDDCLKNSELPRELFPDLGILLATQSGEINHIEDYYLSFADDSPASASAFLFPNTVLNSCGGFLSIHFGLKNFNHTFSSRETTGMEALEYACDLIENEQEERVLVVGMEEISTASLMGYQDIGIMADYKNNELTRGLVMAEGSCAMLLESQESAEARNAASYGRITKIFTDPSHVKNKYNCLISGENGYEKIDILENELQHKSGFEVSYAFKKNCGEYFGASGLFGAALACLANTGNTLVTSFDLNGKFCGMEIDHA